MSISPSESDGDAAGLPITLLILTVVTGLVDAASVLGFDVFTANMTGNIVFLGFAVGGAREFSISRSMISLLGFLLGAVIGGRLGVVMAAQRRRWLVAATLCEALLLLVAGLTSIGLVVEPSTSSYRLYCVIVLTAAAMGLRNATVRRLALPDLTTTVLTMTLTGLAADSSLAGGSNPRAGRRATSVILLFAGAAIGCLLMRWGLALPLFLSGICGLIVAAIYMSPTKLPANASL